MPYNLLVDPLAPFRMASGGIRWLAVADLAAGAGDDDYPVAPAWPRADLDTATYELLIGLLSVALAPKDSAQWRARYHTPPGRGEIAAALAPLVPAFAVDGDGSRFLQEAELEGQAKPVEALFIDAAGEKTREKNADLLTHRARYGALCLPAAAMALHALQAFAPAGGAGIRTSLRGGGPLTALALPQDEVDGRPVPLWRVLWANVSHIGAGMPAPETIFPWLRSDLPLGKSAGGVEIHQGAPPFDAALHPFFGMPRRIWLEVAGEGVCDLTGRAGPVVTGFVQKPYGLNYGLWRHPLTPYRRQKPTDPPYSIKPKSGRFGYRDWVAVTMGDGDGTPLSLPAESVKAARGRAAELSADYERPEARLRVAGWAMNNMEAIAYLVAEQPLPLAEAGEAALMDDVARRMALAGETVAFVLRGAVKTVLAPRAEGAVEAGAVGQARSDFYDATDHAFHDVLGHADLGSHEAEDAAMERWLAVLRRAALSIFDTACPVPIEDALAARRVVAARAGLVATLAGRGKMGAELYQRLELPPPQKRTTGEGEAA